MHASLESAATSPVFTETVAPYLLLDDALTIQAVNDAYLQATQRDREELIGTHMFDAFPDNPEEPSSNGVGNLAASLQHVLRHATTHQMAIQRYDVAPTGSRVFVPKTWSPANSPVTDGYGRAVGVLHHVEDVSAIASCDHALWSYDVKKWAVAASRYHSDHALLVQENVRLSDALVVMAASRGGLAGDRRAVDRRRRFWRLLTSQAATQLWRGWSAALCSLAVEACDSVSGSAVSVEIAEDQQEVLAASDVRAQRFERIYHALGEGPNRAVLLTGVPVHIADVSAEQALWPDYSVEAAAAGIVGLSAFPLRWDGMTFGTFTVYRGQSAPDHTEWMDTAILADLSVSAVLADLEHAGGQWRTGESAGAAAVAAAALSYGLGISFDEAVSRLRRKVSLHHGFVHDAVTDVMRRWST